MISLLFIKVIATQDEHSLLGGNRDSSLGHESHGLTFGDMDELSNTENSRRHEALLKLWTICVKIRQQLAISPAEQCLTAVSPNIYESLVAP